MADPLGISFSPAGDPAKQNGQRPTPAQQAIQTLSLRIPQNAGVGAFTPQALLMSPGGAGLIGDANSAALLEALKRYLFGQIGINPPREQQQPGRFHTSPVSRIAGAGGTMPAPDPGGLQPRPIPLPSIEIGSTAPVAEPPPPAPLPQPSRPSETSFPMPTMRDSRRV